MSVNIQCFQISKHWLKRIQNIWFEVVPHFYLNVSAEYRQKDQLPSHCCLIFYFFLEPETTGHMDSLRGWQGQAGRALGGFWPFRGSGGSLSTVWVVN